jgi:hypothetical protein
MAPISGANWNNSSNAGVWALNLNNVRTNSNNNIGFRSDSGSPRTRRRDGGTKGDVFRHYGAKSVFHRISGRLATSRFERQAVVL